MAGKNQMSSTTGPGSNGVWRRPHSAHSSFRRDQIATAGSQGTESRPPATSWPAGLCHQLLIALHYAES
jgi:hypothetical protein